MWLWFWGFLWWVLWDLKCVLFNGIVWFLCDFDETLCEFMDFIQFQWILQWDNGVRSSSMGLTQPNYAFFFAWFTQLAGLKPLEDRGGSLWMYRVLSFNHNNEVGPRRNQPTGYWSPFMGFNSPPKTFILQWVHACNLCVIYDLSIDWVNTGWGTFVQHVFFFTWGCWSNMDSVTDLSRPTTGWSTTKKRKTYMVSSMVKTLFCFRSLETQKVKLGRWAMAYYWVC